MSAHARKSSTCQCNSVMLEGQTYLFQRLNHNWTFYNFLKLKMSLAVIPTQKNFKNSNRDIVKK